MAEIWWKSMNDCPEIMAVLYNSAVQVWNEKSVHDYKRSRP